MPMPTHRRFISTTEWEVIRQRHLRGPIFATTQHMSRSRSTPLPSQHLQGMSRMRSSSVSSHETQRYRQHAPVARETGDKTYKRWQRKTRPWSSKRLKSPMLCGLTLGPRGAHRFSAATCPLAAGTCSSAVLSMNSENS